MCCTISGKCISVHRFTWRVFPLYLLKVIDGRRYWASLLYIWIIFSGNAENLSKKNRHKSPSAVNVVVILLLYLLWRSVRFNCNSHFDFVYYETDVKVCLIRIRTRISMLFSRDSIGTSQTSHSITPCQKTISTHGFNMDKE